MLCYAFLSYGDPQALFSRISRSVVDINAIGATPTRAINGVPWLQLQGHPLRTYILAQVDQRSHPILLDEAKSNDPVHLPLVCIRRSVYEHFSISKRLRMLGLFFLSQSLQRSTFNAVKLNNDVFKLFINNNNYFMNWCDHNVAKIYLKSQFFIKMIKFDSLINGIPKLELDLWDYFWWETIETR